MDVTATNNAFAANLRFSGGYVYKKLTTNYIEVIIL